MLRPAHDIEVSASPNCGTSDLMVLIAQSVPSATLLPCVATLPAGFGLDDVHVRSGRTTVLARLGPRGRSRGRGDAHPVRASARCAGAQPVPTDEIGTARYERPEQLTPELRSTRYYTFPGGCVSYRFAFDRVATPALVFAADQALGVPEPRSRSSAWWSDRTDLKLCGADVRVSRRRRVVTEHPTVEPHRQPPRRPRRARDRRRSARSIVPDGTVGAPERDVFHAINDLPGWLYPVLWPFQQFGNLLVALVVGVVVALVLRKWWVAVAVVAAVVLKLAGEKAREGDRAALAPGDDRSATSPCAATSPSAGSASSPGTR